MAMAVMTGLATVGNPVINVAVHKVTIYSQLGIRCKTCAILPTVCAT